MSTLFTANTTASTRTQRHQRLLRRGLSLACLLGATFAQIDPVEAGDVVRWTVADGSVERGRAAEPTVVRSRAKGNPNDYWTAERLRGARAMPLPEASDVGPLYTPQSVMPGQESRSAPSSPPVEEIEPAFDHRLFEPDHPPADGFAPLGDFGPQAMSPVGATFTNSRVFPKKALAAYPYRATGKLFMRDPVREIGVLCSAAVVARGLIATAGHCVYDAVEGYFYTDFVFIPAYDRGAAPFKEWAVEEVITTRSWVEGGGVFPNPGDFAILVAKDRAVEGKRRMIGDVTGWLGW